MGTLTMENFSLTCKINRKVESIIRKWCEKLPDNEWSGVLFYTYKGDFDNGLEIICTDVLVMDIGDNVYTAYESNPEVVSYMVDNNLLDCQLGLIHSHNKMSTYFSSTDLNTLISEGEERNHFFSLIVNNDGHYNAKITKKYTAEKIQKIRKYASFGNTEHIDTVCSSNNDISVVAYTVNITDIAIPDTTISIEGRYKELMKRASEKVVKDVEIDSPVLPETKKFNEEDAEVKSIIMQLVAACPYAPASFFVVIDSMPYYNKQRFKSIYDYEIFMINFVAAILETSDIENLDKKVLKMLYKYKGANEYLDCLLNILERY